jgi:hypothetical protein
MENPWAFGWIQLLTICGFLVTIVLGVTGFGRWKRQQLEARRIEAAIEALSLAYESKYVFDNIRSPMAFEYEWQDMPVTPGETAEARRKRGSFYAVAKRIRQNKEFFERAFNMQPKCMAMFGKEAEEIFMLMHKARRSIEVSSEMLAWKVGQYEDREAPDHNAEFYEQCRRDIWDLGAFQPEKDKVGKQLTEFRQRMEKTFEPVIGKEFKGIAGRVGLSQWWTC